MRTPFIIIFILFQPIINYSQEAPYKIKSAKIDFVWSHGISKGTKSLIFDDSGRVEKLFGVEYVDTSVNLLKLMGVEHLDTSVILEKGGLAKDYKFPRSIIHSLYIQTKDSIYSIDLDDKIGSSQRRTYWNLKSLLPPDKKIDEVQFLGKRCDVVQTPVGKMLMWNGICLNKTYEGFPDPAVYEYATSVDEGYVIKDDEFKVPSGVKIQ